LDYYSKWYSGEPFEARGMMVTAPSRTGKSHELNHMIKVFHDAEQALPDGRPAYVVQVLLSGRITWKDLGLKILAALDYAAERVGTQSEIWRIVRDQAKKLGVIGIHFDEVQHVFSKKKESATDLKILDSFKTLMKDPEWPLILILSGVPELKAIVDRYEQLSYLLDPISFPKISMKVDKDELIELCYCLSDAAELDFEPLATDDFLARLVHAGAYRWGLVIELVVTVLSNAVLHGKRDLDVSQFQMAYHQKHGVHLNRPPFSMDDYLDSIDPEKVLEESKKAENKT
jgi:hypothetical protein